MKVGEGHVLVLHRLSINVANSRRPARVASVSGTDDHERAALVPGQGNTRVGSYVDLRSGRKRNVQVEITGPDNKRAADAWLESARRLTFQFPRGIFDHPPGEGREGWRTVNAIAGSRTSRSSGGDGGSVEKIRESDQAGPGLRVRWRRETPVTTMRNSGGG